MQCPKCGGPISSGTLPCPFCGNIIKPTRKQKGKRHFSNRQKDALTLAGIAVFLATGLWFCFYGAALFGATDSQIHIYVEDVRRYNETGTPTGYQYFLINSTIYNDHGQGENDDGSRTIHPQDFELRTSSGGSYRYDPSIPYTTSVKILQFQTVHYGLGFKIPAGETPSALIYHEGVFSVKAVFPA